MGINEVEGSYHVFFCSSESRSKTILLKALQNSCKERNTSSTWCWPYLQPSLAEVSLFDYFSPLWTAYIIWQVSLRRPQLKKIIPSIFSSPCNVSAIIYAQSRKTPTWSSRTNTYGSEIAMDDGGLVSVWGYDEVRHCSSFSSGCGGFFFLFQYF